MQTKTTLIAAAATLAIAAPASAHNQWLLPSRTVLSDTNQMVTVDAGASTEPFTADHNALNVDNVQVWAPDGSPGKIENVAKLRYRTAFDVKIDKPGTWRIGSRSSTVSGTFKVDGQDWALGRRRGPPPGAGPGGTGPGGAGPSGPAGGGGMAGAGPGGEGGPPRPVIDPSRTVATVAEIPANATDLDLTESQARNEFFVTAGAPTETIFRPTNAGLELVPVTHPDDLVANEPAKFRFLVDGKPAANLKVSVIPGGQRYRGSDNAQELTTDSDGLLNVSWPAAGFYWMNATLSDAKPSAAKATKRRMSYTATLEVVAP